MSLCTLGVNHKTAPVAIRERVAFGPGQLNRALGELITLDGVAEAAIVSTCNRTELYCNIEANDPGGNLVEWLGDFHALSHHDLKPHVYRHWDATSVRHLLRVACGLDSLVLGEPQILGQLKSAYEKACDAGATGSRLSRLFQHAFAVAKQVRTDTAIGANAVSVAFAAVGLAKQIFGDLNKRTALMIGAGETIELAMRHLAANGIGHVMVANRSRERAEDLASQYHGEGIPLQDIPDRMHEADVVISSTASPLPVVGKGTVERALKQRKRRPIFMVDIAVPRDIEAQVGELDDVYLYTVDDLQQVVEENYQSRREAAAEAERLIDRQVSEFMAWLRSRDAVGTIRALRTHADDVREEVLGKAKRMLLAGKPADEALEFLAHRLTNKLTHEPTRGLNEAARAGNLETIAVAQRLFSVEASDPEESS